MSRLKPFALPGFWLHASDSFLASAVIALAIQGCLRRQLQDFELFSSLALFTQFYNANSVIIDTIYCMPFSAVLM